MRMSSRNGNWNIRKPEIEAEISRKNCMSTVDQYMKLNIRTRI
jgi:hypothetical protein